MFDTIVEITVGPDEVLFKLHKGLLCNASTYFKAALEGGFKEASEKKISLPEDDPDMFKRFQLWLYTGSVVESPTEASTTVDWQCLFNLYIFGDARGVAHLQNATMDALIDKSHAENLIPTMQYKYVYENTADNSLLRRLLVDWITQRCDLKTWWSLKPGVRGTHS